MGSGFLDRTKISCMAQTLNEWVKKAEVDEGSGAGEPRARQANELRKVSAYFAMAELDRH
jgi:hypothetical protein